MKIFDEPLFILDNTLIGDENNDELLAIKKALELGKLYKEFFDIMLNKEKKKVNELLENEFSIRLRLNEVIQKIKEVEQW